MTLCVTNPNLDALVFRRVTVTLDRAGMKLATGSSVATILVPALSSTRMKLAVLAVGRDVARFDVREVNYRVDGSVALDRVFGLNIPYRHAGHLDAVPMATDGMSSSCAGSDVAVPL